MWRNYIYKYVYSILIDYELFINNHTIISKVTRIE